jgi:hypothetical protein
MEYKGYERKQVQPQYLFTGNEEHHKKKSSLRMPDVLTKTRMGSS